MNLVKGILINLVLLLVTVNAMALTGARLIGQSTSGQTAVFNLGMHDGVRDGDFAVIVREVRNPKIRDMRLVPIAHARNVKISSTHSVWILYKILDPKLLVKGQSYLILSESQMLNGRRDPRFGRISVITDKDKVALETQEVLSEDKDRLSKLKTLYPEIMPLHGKESRSSDDGELVDVYGWKKNKNNRFRTALYKSPHQDDFKKQLRLSTFEKVVTAYLKKVNKPDFNYDKFYDEQMKESFTNEFRKRSNFSTEYEKYLSSQKNKSIEDARIYRQLLEKGEGWSEDFSDEDLGLVLKQVSILQERDRRVFVGGDPKRFTLFAGVGLNFTDQQTEKDAAYRREGAYSVDLDLEGIPLLRHETLERLTFDVGFRLNRTAIENDNYNFAVDELSVRGGFNWYPLYSPATYEAACLFFGAYVRSGMATLDSISANNNGRYTVLTMPGFRGGMKYNFKNNVGIRISLSMETIEMDRYKQNTLGSSLPNRTQLFESKMNFALAYLF